MWELDPANDGDRKEEHSKLKIGDANFNLEGPVKEGEKV